MRKLIHFAIFTLLFSIGSTLYSQDPHFLIRTNVLTLPQPNAALEIEIQPIHNIGIIVGASTRSGLSNIGYLRWFRFGKSDCEAEFYSLLTGLAYLHPFNDRWEIGGKLLYQYERSYVDIETCDIPGLHHPNAQIRYIVNSHSVILLPSARYLLTRHLFLEAALGVGLNRGEFDTGVFNKWILDIPAQLNFGLKF